MRCARANRLYYDHRRARSVTGVSGATFTVNSRVISLTLAPALTATTLGQTALQNYPLVITLAHKVHQPDAPYRKGAILCVHWKYK